MTLLLFQVPVGKAKHGGTIWSLWQNLRSSVYRNLFFPSSFYFLQTQIEVYMGFFPLNACMTTVYEGLESSWLVKSNILGGRGLVVRSLWYSDSLGRC